MIGGSLKWPLRAVFCDLDLDLCSMCWQLRTSLWQSLCVTDLLSLVTGQFSFMQRRPSSCVAADGVEQYEKHSWRHRGDTESCTLAPSYLATDQGDPCSQILKRHLGVAVGFWYRWQDPYWIKEFLPCDSSWPCWWVQHGWTVANNTDLEEYISARLGWRL